MQTPKSSKACFNYIIHIIRPYQDYGDTIYEQTFNSSFHEKLESIQYNASLGIKVATCKMFVSRTVLFL